MEDPLRLSALSPPNLSPPDLSLPEGAAPPYLFETLLWDGTQARRLDLHLARLAQGAGRLGYPLDLAAARALLAGPHGPGPARLRLTLSDAGALDLTQAALPAPAGAPPAPAGTASAPRWRVALAPRRLQATDPWLQIKSSRRAAYDADRAALPAGIDEWIYANTDGDLCEGTITSLFFDLGAGLSVPPLACGCLPGCLRAEMLAQGQLREAVLPLADLGRAQLWLGNSLRGLIAADLVPAP